MYLLDFLIAFFHVPWLTNWRLNRLIGQFLGHPYFRMNRSDDISCSIIRPRLAKRIKLYGSRAITPLFEHILRIPDGRDDHWVGMLWHLDDLMKLLKPEHCQKARAILRSRNIQSSEILQDFRNNIVERLGAIDDEENFRVLLHLRDKVMPFSYCSDAPSEAINVDTAIFACQQHDKEVVNAAILALTDRLRLYRV